MLDGQDILADYYFPAGRVDPVHHLTCEVRTDSVSRVVLEPAGEEIQHELKDG